MIDETVPESKELNQEYKKSVDSFWKRIYLQDNLSDMKTRHDITMNNGLSNNVLHDQGTQFMTIRSKFGCYESLTVGSSLVGCFESLIVCSSLVGCIESTIVGSSIGFILSGVLDGQKIELLGRPFLHILVNF